jgi:hypothetical protein
MAISLSPETQRLIEEQMRESGLSSADELVRLALDTLKQATVEYYEDLDPETRAGIEEAEAQYARGEAGMTVDEAFARLREKYLRG